MNRVTNVCYPKLETCDFASVPWVSENDPQWTHEFNGFHFGYNPNFLHYETSGSSFPREYCPSATKAALPYTSSGMMISRAILYGSWALPPEWYVYCTTMWTVFSCSLPQVTPYGIWWVFSNTFIATTSNVRRGVPNHSFLLLSNWVLGRIRAEVRFKYNTSPNATLTGSKHAFHARLRRSGVVWFLRHD